MANFDRIFEIVVGNEGGYVNDPDDAGGETKFGISKRSYPKEDIPNLTIDRAKYIYNRDFWNILKCDQIINDQVALNIFDFAINAGTIPAAKIVQRVVNCKADGVIGPDTLSLVNRTESLSLIKAFQKARSLFYVDVVIASPVKIKYLKGWISRAFL